MRYDEFHIQDITLYHSTVPSGKRPYWAHHHTECELSILKSGSGTYSVKDMEYSFHQGDIFLFGSNEIHCITEIHPGDPFILFNVRFSPRLLWDSQNQDSLPLLTLFTHRSEHFTNRICRNNPHTPYLRDTIFHMEQEIRKKPPGYALKIKMDLYDILLCLIRHFDYVQENAAPLPGGQILEQLARAMEYIDTHLAEAISLDDIAKHAMLSSAYFSTLFKKYNGLSPWDYITIKRVELAIHLLRTTKMTKLEIASSCGFSSSANFYKAFKHITGKSPGDYTPKANH